MRRATGLMILAAMLLIGGIACFVERALAPQAARVPVGAVQDQQAYCYTGAALLLLGGSSALLGLAVVRRGCRELEHQLGQMVASERLRALDPRDGGLLSLVRATNELVEFAERAVTDATVKLKELQIQLKVATAQRQHAEAIIYSISDAVLVTDPFDELVLANESAARTFGFDIDSATRMPIDRFIHDPTMVQLIRDMRNSGSGRTGRRIVEYTLKGDSGSQQAKTFKVTLSCVAGQEDEPAGVVVVLHDMTKEKEVAELKNDFVSNVSHELRTPLASIKAYVEMLIDGEAEDEKTKREFYEVIQNEANRLGRLIDNILNISRIESGLVKINKQPQSLTVILKEAIEVISPQAKLKQIQIDEQLTPVFYQTHADHDMLYQAVLNLLSNAVKYTPEGGRITVQTVVDEVKRKVVTRISDTGVGIPPKDLPFVFDKFYRAEANNRMAKGTGLGLSLVKHIIETVHRGRIFVESQVGKGSTFGFELDLCQ
ncbi:sensor histidine kinase [Fontivita pretiosa]|uniref:sensor histidine kinase n=1 Tax=Fontivita pretiosa TaxID=2989684 RepID=UPI003D181A51